MRRVLHVALATAALIVGCGDDGVGRTSPDGAASDTRVDTPSDSTTGGGTFTTGQPASIVIGKPDLESTSPAPLAANTIDPPSGNPTWSAGMLVLSDGSNNRVLVFSAIPTTNYASAALVIGQPDFTAATAATSAAGMRAPNTVVAADGKLFVSEEGGHRVTIFSSIPTTNGAAATVIVGQPDATTFEPTTCTATRFQPFGIAVGGGTLVVADTLQNRVLIWSSIPASDDVPADVVLGQATPTTCAANDDDQNGSQDAAPTARTLRRPIDVWTDGTRLAVVEDGNHRVLIWNAIPTSSFQPADLVIGQPDFASAPAATTASGLTGPLRFTSDGSHAAVADGNRVLIWNGLPTANGQAADVVLGQSSFTSDAANDSDGDGITDDAAANTLSQPAGLLFAQGQLVVADNANGRYLIYVPH